MKNLKQVVLSGGSTIIETTDNRYFKVPSKYYTELALYIENPSSSPLSSSLHHALSEAGTFLHAEDRMDKSSVGKSIDTLMTKIISIFAHRFSFFINPLYILITIILYLFLNEPIFRDIFQNGRNFIFELGWGDMLTALLIVTLSGIFHEVGHAAACYRYVGSVGSSGFKLDYVLPTIYVDVSCIHLIDDRWKKMIVGVSGIYFQIIFILPFYFIDFFNEEIQSAIFRFTVFLIIFNLIPMKGSDGYWMIYDLIPKAKAHRFWRDKVYVNLANALKFAILALIVAQFVRLLLNMDFPLLSSPPFLFLIFSMLSITTISYSSKLVRYVYGYLNPRKV